MKDWTLDQLKEKADELGVSYSGNIKEATLLKKIEKEILNLAEETELENGKTNEDTKTPEEVVQEQLDSAKSLVRIKLSCLNPMLKSRKGIRVQVGNSVLGTIGRFVPFDREWHVEKILVDDLKSRKFQTFESEESKYGVTRKRTVLSPAFNVIELEDLTKEELEKLAEEQRLTNRLED